MVSSITCSGDRASPPALRSRAGRCSRRLPIIERLVDRLLATEPVDVRGVALARLLITDGAGPLYSNRRQRAVTEAVARALDAVPAV